MQSNLPKPRSKSAPQAKQPPTPQNAKRPQRQSRQPRRSRGLLPRRNPFINPVTMAYAHCRVNPFTSSRAVGIPDAAAGKRIVVDVREYYDVTFSSSGKLCVTMLPCSSSPLIFKDATNASTGGIITNSGGDSFTMDTTRSLNTSGSWIHLPVSAFKTYADQDPTITPQTINHPYYATASRIVSQACKIMFTGKPVNASGTITVTCNDQTLDPQPVTINNAITRYTAGGSAMTAYGANSCLTTTLNYNFSAPPINGAVTKPLAEGIMVLNKRRTPMSLFKAVPDTLRVLLEEDKSTCLLGGYAATASLTHSGVADLDCDFMTPMIYISGAAASETVRFEVVTCVEYLLDSRSTFAQLAQDQPYAPLPSIQNVDRKVASLPIAADPSFFQKAIKFVLDSASPVATAMGGPAMGAAVSTITGAFRRTFNI